MAGFIIRCEKMSISHRYMFILTAYFGFNKENHLSYFVKELKPAQFQNLAYMEDKRNLYFFYQTLTSVFFSLT